MLMSEGGGGGCCIHMLQFAIALIRVQHVAYAFTVCSFGSQVHKGQHAARLSDSTAVPCLARLVNLRSFLLESLLSESTLAYAAQASTS